MSLIKESREIEAVDKLLALKVSGSFFFKQEMADYMDEEAFAELRERLDHLYNKAVVFNCGRAFNPKYHFNRMVDGDTQDPKVVLQLIMPGNTLMAAKVSGEIVLHVSFSKHGALTLSLPVESEALKLARQNNWKASDEELEALTKLIEAAKTLQELGSKSFPVKLDVGRTGVTVQTQYYNPADQVRAALAR